MLTIKAFVARVWTHQKCHSNLTIFFFFCFELKTMPIWKQYKAIKTKSNVGANSPKTKFTRHSCIVRYTYSWIPLKFEFWANENDIVSLTMCTKKAPSPWIQMLHSIAPNIVDDDDSNTRRIYLNCTFNKIRSHIRFGYLKPPKITRWNRESETDAKRGISILNFFFTLRISLVRFAYWAYCY